jgi:hypothetical protein
LAFLSLPLFQSLWLNKRVFFARFFVHYLYDWLTHADQQKGGRGSDISIDIKGAKIDCLSLFMCPLLAQLKTGFFSCFSDAAVYSTNKQTRQALSSLYS